MDLLNDFTLVSLLSYNVRIAPATQKDVRCYSYFNLKRAEKGLILGLVLSF